MGMALDDRLDDLKAEEKKTSSLKELQQEAMDICYFKSSLSLSFSSKMDESMEEKWGF